jgi:hypothetical protein
MNFTKNNQNGKTAAGRINAVFSVSTSQYTRSRGITKRPKPPCITIGVCNSYRYISHFSIPSKAVFQGAENEVWSAQSPNTITAFKKPIQPEIPVSILPIPVLQPMNAVGGEAA